MIVLDKLLLILHTSPPLHGAAKVGDVIKSSKKINKHFNTSYIEINSSTTIDNIGVVDFKKLLRNFVIFIKVFFQLVIFRPKIIYFTASVGGIAFYRDFFISILLKGYSFFSKSELFFHYHTKGVDRFCSGSYYRTLLVNFFLKNVNVILLSSSLKDDLKEIDTYKNLYFLPNGIEDIFDEENKFNAYINQKFKHITTKINVLFLSNMLESKGYVDVLHLASRLKAADLDVSFHFAGAWGGGEIREGFYNYIEKHNLTDVVTYHGFVSDEEKNSLLMTSQVLIFPTKNEAFGLVVPEAFSYGIPVITSDEGSLPFIVSNETGIILNHISDLDSAFINIINNFINVESSLKCRKRYVDYFTIEKFEYNLLNILLKDETF